MEMFCYYGYESTALNFNLNLSLWDIRKLNRDYYEDYRIFDYSGDNAASWSVKIPTKTGYWDNSPTAWTVYLDYGGPSKWILPPSGRSFEL